MRVNSLPVLSSLYAVPMTPGKSVGAFPSLLFGYLLHLGLRRGYAAGASSRLKTGEPYRHRPRHWKTWPRLSTSPSCHAPFYSQWLTRVPSTAARSSGRQMRQPCANLYPLLRRLISSVRARKATMVGVTSNDCSHCVEHRHFLHHHLLGFRRFADRSSGFVRPAYGDRRCRRGNASSIGLTAGSMLRGTEISIKNMGRLIRCRMARCTSSAVTR